MERIRRITEVPRIGKAASADFAELGVVTLEDMIRFRPRAYDDRREEIMKGLLIKDIRLMKGQSTILLALLILVAVFTGVVSDVSPSFVVAYITIFLSIFVASTISYDEYDHGYLFLMTLPITRNKYVNEK